MSVAVLEQLAAREEQQRQAAQDEYAMLVERLAYGTNDPTADEAAAIVKAAGKTVEDLTDAVHTKKRRIAAVEAIERAADKDVRYRAAQEAIQRIEEKYKSDSESLLRKAREDAAPYHEQIQQVHADGVAADAAQRTMRDTAPELAKAYYLANDLLRQTDARSKRRRERLKAPNANWRTRSPCRIGTKPAGNCQARLTATRSRLPTSKAS